MQHKGQSVATFEFSPGLLNEHEAARTLGLKVATLRRWRWAGKPPGFLKLGAAVRYDPAELAAFVAAARRTSTVAGLNRRAAGEPAGIEVEAAGAKE